MFLSQDQIAVNWAYNLKRLRERAGLSKYELAKLAGIVSNNEQGSVNVSAITRYEDKAKTPSALHLANIAHVLGVAIEQLLMRKAPSGFSLPRKKRKARAA